MLKAKLQEAMKLRRFEERQKRQALFNLDNEDGFEEEEEEEEMTDESEEDGEGEEEEKLEEGEEEEEEANQEVFWKLCNFGTWSWQIRERENQTWIREW